MTEQDLEIGKYSYEQAVSYINSIPRFVALSPLESFDKTAIFYRYLIEQGVVRDGEGKVFHVAGTNGKGSVCAFLRSIHMTMGRSVGVFTSPHLVDIRERITIDDEMISEEDFLDAFMTVMSYLQRFKNEKKYSDYTPVYFTWLFFIAAVYFSKRSLDAIVWETGLGGKYDATNVTENKSVTVITEVGLDHMEILGDTKEKIAAEKAGIIRAGVPVVTVDKDRDVLNVIKTEAQAKGSPIVVTPNASKIRQKMSDKGIDFSYDSHYYNNATLAVVGHAVYQTENATLALTAMEAVYSADELNLDTMNKGLKLMHHQGRMEMIAPGIYFDGAHNPDGIEALLKSVELDGCTGARFMLFSAAADKQAGVELDMIAGSHLFKKICIVPISGTRGRSNEELSLLRDRLISRHTDCEFIDDMKKAYDKYSSCIKKEDRLYVCGSLYLIGELKGYMDS